MSSVCICDTVIKSKPPARGGCGQLLQLTEDRGFTIRALDQPRSSSKEIQPWAQGGLPCIVLCVQVIFVKGLNNILCCCVNYKVDSPPPSSQIIQK